MEPIDTYLLAIGEPRSAEVIADLSINPKYITSVQDAERAAKKEYLFIEVTRDTKRVIIATYVTQEEARIFQAPDFKIIVNH